MTNNRIKKEILEINAFGEEFRICRNLKYLPLAAYPSYIQTDQWFLNDRELKVQILGRGFAWLDTGTHDSLSEASTYIEVVEKRQGLKIACLEAIAYRKGWISEERMRELAQPMIKNQYGQYLFKVIDEMKQDINSTNILDKVGK